MWGDSQGMLQTQSFVCLWPSSIVFPFRHRFVHFALPRFSPLHCLSSLSHPPALNQHEVVEFRAATHFHHREASSSTTFYFRFSNSLFKKRKKEKKDYFTPLSSHFFIDVSLFCSQYRGLKRTACRRNTQNENLQKSWIAHRPHRETAIDRTRTSIRDRSRGGVDSRNKRGAVRLPPFACSNVCYRNTSQHQPPDDDENEGWDRETLKQVRPHTSTAAPICKTLFNTLAIRKKKNMYGVLAEEENKREGETDRSRTCIQIDRQRKSLYIRRKSLLFILFIVLQVKQIWR